MAYNAETKEWVDAPHTASGPTVANWSRLHRFIHKTGGAAYNLDDLAISAVFKLWTQAAAAGDTKSSHFGVVSWWAGFENFILK